MKLATRICAVAIPFTLLVGCAEQPGKKKDDEKSKDDKKDEKKGDAKDDAKKDDAKAGKGEG